MADGEGGTDVSGAGRFLVVDPDEEFLADAMAALEAVGASVVVVQTPLSAVWALERHRFDAIVCSNPELRDELRNHWPSLAMIPGAELPRDPDDLARWLHTL